MKVAKSLHKKILDARDAAGVARPSVALTEYEGKCHKGLARDLARYKKQLIDAPKGADVTQIPGQIKAREKVLETWSCLDVWAEEIEKHHLKKDDEKFVIHWSNSNATMWTREHGEWEVMKLYCSHLGKHDDCIKSKKNPDSVDMTCMFTMLTMCDEFKEEPFCVDMNLAKEVLAIRNGEFAHTSSMELSQGAMEEGMDTLLSLLRKTKGLQSDDLAKKAIVNIELLREQALSVIATSITSDEFEQLKSEHASYKAELDKALQENLKLKKKKLGH